MHRRNEDYWTKKLAEFFVPDERITVGPGEDCVHILQIPGKELVVSVDSHVEGVHFELDFLNLPEIGHRSLALALSDLASVGASPITYLINLEVPPYLTLENVLEIYRGFEELNKEYCISPSGGNLTKGQKLALTITVIGEVNRGKGLLRSKAKEGDVVAVTGDLGKSLAGYTLIKEPHLQDALLPEVRNKLLEKFKTPWPRVKDMMYIMGLANVHSAIDITDGLGKDLWRVAQMSEVEIVIYEENLPISDEVIEFSRLIRKDIYSIALASGEELEVVFTLPSEEFEKLKNLRVKVTKIGEVRAGFSPGLLLKRKNGEEIPIGHFGYDHLGGF